MVTLWSVCVPVFDWSDVGRKLSDLENSRARRWRQWTVQCHRRRSSRNCCHNTTALRDLLEHQVSGFPVLLREHNEHFVSGLMDDTSRSKTRALIVTRYGDIGSTFNTTGLSVVQASGQAEQSRVSFVLLGLGLLAYLAV